MKRTLENAIEIEDQGGAVPASYWVTGSGRYISRRPVPAYCAEVLARDIGNLKGKTRKTAEKLLRESPRIQKLIAVVDRRGLNRSIDK